MNIPRDPERWSEANGGAPGELRDLLQNARSDVPSSEALAALGVAVPTLAELAGSALSSGAQASAGAASKALGIAGASKALGATVLVVVTGASVYAVYGGSSPSPSVPPAVEAPVKMRDRAGVPRSEPVAPSESAEDELAPAPEPADREPVRTQQRAKAPAAPPAELPLLERARSQLGHNPSAALDLVRRHEQQFPNSQFVQEREVIRIEALRRLGKSDEAERRGREFDERFPESAHRSKLRREPQ
jgi:hypothetical protein